MPGMGDQLELLRQAFVVVSRVCDNYPEDQRFKWIKQSLFELLRDEWFAAYMARSGMVAETLDAFLAEAGSRLSQASRDKITNAIAVLEELLADYNVKVEQPELVAEAAVVLSNTSQMLIEASKSVKKKGKPSEDGGDSAKDGEPSEEDPPPPQDEDPEEDPSEEDSVDEGTDKDPDAADETDEDTQDETDENGDDEDSRELRRMNPGLVSRVARKNDAVSARIAWSAYYALRDALGKTIANRILIRRQQVMKQQKQQIAEALGVAEEDLFVYAEEAAVAELAEGTLTAATRKKIPEGKFGDPVARKYPIHDKAHADNAAARLAQQKKAGRITQAYFDKVMARIRRAQRKFGEKPPVKMKEDLVEGAPLSIYTESVQVRNGESAVQVQAQLFAEAEGSTPENPKFMMAVIAEGMSGNRVLYTAGVLREATPLLEGKPIYIDHPDRNNPMRSLRTKAGWWDEARYAEGMQIGGAAWNGIVARVNLFSKESNPAPWLEGMIRESLAAGRPDLVGISIWAAGPAEIKRDGEGGLYREATKIVMFGSADAVAEPGARGQALFAASNTEDLILAELEQLTMDDLTAGRPDLVEALRAQLAAETPAASTPPPTPDPVVSPDMTQFNESVSAVQRMRAEMYLDRQLAASELPSEYHALIRARIGTQILAESEIDAILKEYGDIFAATPKPQASVGSESHVLTSGVTFPLGSNYGEGQISPLAQAHWALNEFFKCNIPDEMKGKFPRIHSFREFYAGITGDTLIDGVYDMKRASLGAFWGKPIEQFAEALPGATHVVGGGTITMANLLGLSMNRRLMEAYEGQPQWWRPVVSTTNISNFKQQQRIRLHNFGSLTERTVDGAEYVELDWGETQEVYTPTEYGNVVTVGRRAIINDDLDGIQRIPGLLGVSAAVTINEYVANFFLANSGNGPVMADGVQVFNAAHGGNKGAAALSQSEAINARTTMAKFTNQAGKRIGVVGRYLLVPAELEAEAWKLVVTPQEPSTPNNARNILADSERGFRMPISVPQFTDANNWYLMADPAQIAGIELGFLFGREDPEFFQQTDPSVGMVFTNDVIAHKIRHDYGGGWLDWRAAFGAIVA